VWLWEELAKHYKDNPWIAGYNLLNEPTDEKHTRLVALYDRLFAAIRPIDQNHIIFLDGNTYATDFTHFPDDAGTRWPNTAYAIHDYSLYGFPSSPEPYDRTEEQRRRMYRGYEKKREWMDKRGLCVWNGEWGPVYARRQYEGDETDAINERRYMVLKDQLDIYAKVSENSSNCGVAPLTLQLQDRLSWSIWLYKDIGFQGMVHVDLSTPYMTLFKDFLLKKHRLAADSWGADDQYVRHVYTPLVELVTQNVDDPDHLKMYPYPVWTVQRRTERLAREILVAEFLVKEWAEKFRGMDEKKLDEVARSFLFENCVKRDGLNKVLTDHAKEVGL
jgi:hypothetical protein